MNDKLQDDDPIIICCPRPTNKEKRTFIIDTKNFKNRTWNEIVEDFWFPELSEDEEYEAIKQCKKKEIRGK